MRNLLIVSTLAAAALAGGVQASPGLVPVNPGDVQLAYAAGVPPGQYTRVEMMMILEARREEDVQKLNYYLSGTNRRTGVVSPEAMAQLEAAAGVTGGGFTVNELQRLIRAREEEDDLTVAFILNRQARPPAPAEVVTQGEAMLAALIGVDPARYTLAELVAMQPQDDEDED